MTSPFKLVDTFNKQVIGIDRPEIKALELKEQSWLVNVLNEERDELEAAFIREDIVAQVDAINDLIYFAIGGLTRLGITPEQQELCFGAVHAANMAKMKGRKGERAVSHDLDAVKPEGWNPPEETIKLVLFGDKE